jgi:hypothetical protein
MISDPSCHPWRWPLDLARYDRTPQLSATEQACLEALAQPSPSKRGYLLKQSRLALERLLQPMEDALQITQPIPATRYLALFHLVLDMHRLQSAFWQWTPHEWQHVFTEDYHAARLGPIHQYYRHLVAMVYLLTDLRDVRCGRRLIPDLLARDVFGQQALDNAQARILQALCQLGYRPSWSERHLPTILSYMLLLNRHPHLETVTLEHLEAWSQEQTSLHYQNGFRLISYALHYLGILPRPLERKSAITTDFEVFAGVPAEWLGWCQRWRNTTTLEPDSARRYFDLLLKVGRWLAHAHPDIRHPGDWTRELAAEYVAAVNRFRIGDYTARYHRNDVGKPISPAYQAHLCTVMRMFFRDCQEWGWIPIRFDPGRSFATPRLARSHLVPRPRVIADDIWAKLVWAGLNLTAEDLPVHRWAEKMDYPGLLYPLEMIRAVVLTWLFAGLRLDELRRLPVGCIRWQQDEANEMAHMICLLDVPISKNDTAFTKPVDRLVGDAIHAWEQVRPTQPPLLDPKTNELVHYLFAFRGKQLGKQYRTKPLSRYYVVRQVCRRRMPGVILPATVRAQRLPHSFSMPKSRCRCLNFKLGWDTVRQRQRSIMPS